ncbi:MAG: T9SS type A sorting domain-containing protein [Bacteroidota bacterium]|nr:T9SS type A sorting domain-containing protein [Bacteroidota bacterium]
MRKLYILFLALLIPFTIIAGIKVNSPQPVAPAQDAETVSLNAIIDWTAVCGYPGIYYVLQLNENESFDNPYQITTSVTSFKSGFLKFATDYYWRVKAIDSSGESDWSEVYHFTTICYVTPQSPASGQTNSDIEIFLDWSDIEGTQNYNVEIDTSFNFGSEILESYTLSADASEFTVSGLLFGEEYYWRVRASHVNDTSVWSEVMSFTTLNTLTVLSPQNEALNQSPDTELICDEVQGVTLYDFQISMEDQFINPEVYSSESASFLSPENYFGETYYWRVRARNNGVHTVWSDSRCYTVVNKVFINTPQNNADPTSRSPVFKWDAISGLEGYQLLLDRNPEFVNFPIPISGDANSYQCDKILYPETTYYWKMNAISGNDTTQWSETYAFTTGDIQGIEETSSLPFVFPIPCDKNLRVINNSLYDSNFEIRVLDLSGKVVIINNYSENIESVELDTKVLRNGMYILRLSDNKSVYSLKFVVKH